VSVVRVIVATRSSGPPASGNIIKEMPGSVASGTPYICVATCKKSLLNCRSVGVSEILKWLILVTAFYWVFLVHTML